MKKTALAASVIAAGILMAATAGAELKTMGAGANMDVDISEFPQKMKDIFPLFKVKCVKCHGLDRTYVTLQTGITPSGTIFDYAAIDAYGAKMLRKPDADMSKQEVKVVLELLRYMLDEAAK